MLQQVIFWPKIVYLSKIMLWTKLKTLFIANLDICENFGKTVIKRSKILLFFATQFLLFMVKIVVKKP